MRILIAPDSFKGSLTSAEAAAAMALGICSVRPDVQIIQMPLADGGEGTMDVLQSSGYDGGNMLFDDGTVLIESAAFIGLRLTAMSGDVFERGSGALGEAVLKALNADARDLRIGLGGSATVDGGLGLLMALGCKVLAADGVSVSADLNGLMQARRLDIEGLDQRLNDEDMRLTILSDVLNPLCGVHGAVYMYGAQKGIEAARLADVEAAMLAWAVLCEDAFGLSAQTDRGAAAAGGLGFVLRLLSGRIVSGAHYVMQAKGFEKLVSTLDWVLTGEGMSDAQTVHGKLPFVVAQAARKAGVRVALISGDVLNEDQLLDYFDVVMAAKPDGLSVSEAMQNAAFYLSNAAALWADGLRQR